MQIITTHNGTFHLDEMFAIACIKKFLGDSKEVSIIRTREEEIIKSSDWVVDVGGKYDHANKRYDHHQSDGPIRPSGIPYAAFGLIWKHYGEQLCGGNQAAADLIDKDFIQAIDANDNGVPTYKPLLGDARIPTLWMLPSLWRPNWDTENIDEDTAFYDLIPWIEQVLDKLIKTYISRTRAHAIFDETYRQAEKKDWIVAPKGVWPKDINLYPDTYFVLYHDAENNHWKAKCLSENFACRKSFPESWRGLRAEELRRISGIKTAVFVHQAGFLAVAKTRQDVELMCQKAIIA